VLARGVAATASRSPTQAFSPGVIQNPLEYDTRTHHSNIDTYDRLVPEDLRQASVVLATLLYNTAMRDQLLPCEP
jgi:hypothetical protein